MTRETFYNISTYMCKNSEYINGINVYLKYPRIFRILFVWIMQVFQPNVLLLSEKLAFYSNFNYYN